MQRVKRRIFSGVVCEQEVFNVSDRLNRARALRQRKSENNTRSEYQDGNTRGW